MSDKPTTAELVKFIRSLNSAITTIDGWVAPGSLARGLTLGLVADRLEAEQKHDPRSRQTIQKLSEENSRLLSSGKKLKDRLETAEAELAAYNQDGMERVNEVLKEIPVLAMARKLRATEATIKAADELADEWENDETLGRERDGIICADQLRKLLRSKDNG